MNDNVAKSLLKDPSTIFGTARSLNYMKQLRLMDTIQFVILVGGRKKADKKLWYLRWFWNQWHCCGWFTQHNEIWYFSEDNRVFVLCTRKLLFLFWSFWKSLIKFAQVDPISPSGNKELGQFSSIISTL